MTPQETQNTPGTDRAQKADGTFGPLLIGVGLLVVVIDTFLTGGFRPGISILGGLLVLVGCTERLVGALRAAQPVRRPAEAPLPTSTDR